MNQGDKEMASAPQVVIDTNVWVSAFRSRRAASWHLINAVTDGLLVPSVSVPLLLEYEKVFRREHRAMQLASEEEASRLTRVIASLSDKHKIHFLWRAFVRDPDSLPRT